MAVDATQSKGLEWKWIVFGVVIGTLLCVVLHQMVAQTFHIPLIPTFMSLLGFVVMGIIIGYKSPGFTIKEPAIGGVVTILVVGYVLSFWFDYDFTVLEQVLAPLVGLILGVIGGWVGEQIQVTPEEAAKELAEEQIGVTQWGWVLAGTVVAFILNAFFVIGGFALLKFGVTGILLALATSFLIAGFIVGYFSPGVTIKEAAYAGALSVVLNAGFLLSSGLMMMEEISYAIIGLVGGFILSLVGGLLGEKAQAAMDTKIKHDAD